MDTQLDYGLGRVVAIGDIHGCLTALDALLDMIRPSEGDRIVMLGDAIDRGPDSRGVITRLMGLAEAGLLAPILGNHDQMMLDYFDGRPAEVEWLVHGGAEALNSYGGAAGVHESHLAFIRSWGDYFEDPSHFYTHGNYRPALPLKAQPWDHLRWESLNMRTPGPHCSGKTAVVGHTANKRGEVLNLGHLVCIDTWCFGGGWLTAFEPETGRLWQSSRGGETREAELPAVTR